MLGRLKWMLAEIDAGRRLPCSPETAALAKRAAYRCARRERVLARMAPEARDRAIKKWAARLAGDVAGLTD